MQRGHLFKHFVVSAIVFSGACATDVTNDAQGDGEDERPEVGLTTEAVFHNDSLTFLEQHGIGWQQQTLYGVTGNIQIAAFGSGPNGTMNAAWGIYNDKEQSRIKYAVTVHCENEAESYNTYQDIVLQRGEKREGNRGCKRIAYAEMSFIIDNNVQQP